MATVRWEPKQLETAQVGTVSITGYDVTTTYKITIGSAVVSVLGQGGTTTTTATALTAALAAEQDGRFTEITWTSSGAVITATAVTAGVPFTLTSSVSGGGGTIGSYTAVTANTSQNDAADVLNWSGGALPGSGDTVNIDDSSVSLLWNLQAPMSTTIGFLNVDQSFLGTIGLPEYNPNGYLEYRTTHYTFINAAFAPTINIGQGIGNGSGRLKFDFGSCSPTTLIYNSGTPLDTNLESVLFKNGGGSCIFKTLGQGANLPSVGIAVIDGESLTSNGITVDGGFCRIGAGVTCVTHSVFSGTMLRYAQSSGQSYTVRGGLLVFYRSTTTLTMIGGAAIWFCGSSNGATLTTLLMGPGTTLDCSLDPNTKTITNTTQHIGSGINDPAATIVFTNAIATAYCGYEELNNNLGRNRTFLPT